MNMLPQKLKESNCPLINRLMTNGSWVCSIVDLKDTSLCPTANDQWLMTKAINRCLLQCPIVNSGMPLQSCKNVKNKCRCIEAEFAMGKPLEVPSIAHTLF